jgi:signal transduction histidine kinase
VRRRLVLLSLATTVLVVVAFVVPLGLLVRRQAVDSAKVAAERDAQSVAGLVALASAVGDGPDSVAGALGELPAGTIVVLDGDVLGEPRPGQGSLVPAATDSRSTVGGDVDGGWEIALPVVTASGVIAVDSFVTAAELTAGVATAWTLLGLLALVLVALAVWVADRLGGSLTAPISDLATSAHRLAEGDLSARVEPSDPRELRETGEAFNYLAERLDQLLAEERETAADLSHRLRTPLTSLRLQAESLGNSEERKAMISQVDRLEHAMNQVIDLARSRAAHEPGESDLDRVVSERSMFWSVLAEEQDREVGLELAGSGAVVPVSADDLGVVVDTIIGNVFAHTPAGTGFTVRTGAKPGPWLEVVDDGPGFVGRPPVERGASGSGSTGLGLDIVRKTVGSAGGTVDAHDHPGGGAVVRVRFG